MAQPTRIAITAKATGMPANPHLKMRPAFRLAYGLRSAKVTSYKPLARSLYNCIQANTTEPTHRPTSTQTTDKKI